MKNYFSLAAIAVTAASLIAGCASNDSGAGNNGTASTPAESTPSAATTAASTPGNPSQIELKIGDVAPTFTLRDQDNKAHKLSDYKGKVVVLAFYPADMTKGCTLEAHKLSTIAPELQKRGVKMFGVSVQDVNSKKQFCEKEGITYTLLADAEKSASRDYGVLQPSGVAKRTTFVIAPDGKIGAMQKEVQPISSDQDTLKMVNDVLKKS